MKSSSQRLEWWFAMRLFAPASGTVVVEHMVMMETFRPRVGIVVEKGLIRWWVELVSGLWREDLEAGNGKIENRAIGIWNGIKDHATQKFKSQVLIYGAIRIKELKFIGCNSWITDVFTTIHSRKGKTVIITHQDARFLLFSSPEIS